MSSLKDSIRVLTRLCYADSNPMRVSDEMYRLIVEAVPEGIWVANPQGLTLFSNPRMAEILGVDVESMASRSCFDHVFPDELEQARAHFERNLAGDREPFDFRLRRADGSPVWVRISGMPMLDASGATVGLLGLFSDISERKQTEAALRESEERFRNMADTAPVMIWVTDPNKLSTFFNRRWLEFRGRTWEQEEGFGWSEGIHPEDAEACMKVYSSAFEARSGFQTEKRLLRADGEYRTLLCTGVPRFGESGAFAGYVGCSVDITDLRRAQERSLETQKLESLGILARGVAHDFNNLLGSILANSELALADLDSASAVREGIEEIQTVAVRAAEIVRELMIFAGQEDPVFEQVDLSELVGEMLQLLKISISKRAALRTDLQKDAPRVRANAAQMRQVVMNLITNASEALGENGGTISITLRQVRSGSEEHLLLEVSDTGCGMTEETQARIFDPFFTTKFAGRGLGLAAVRGIIRSHGGTINVVSAPREGSRFEILLRCSGEPASERREVAGSVRVDGAEKLSATVLLVEDEDALREAVSKMLRREGAIVIEAADGQTAVNLFRARAREIDIVLLDVTLPGISGQEVLRELRRIQSGVKVIVTSAYSQDWARTTIGGNEPWLYIRKPYRFGELMDLVQKVCLERLSA
jgi:two-component system, cell cycle sensor histidine kinase and response regulator CckA